MGSNMYLLIGGISATCSMIFGYIGYRNGLRKECKSEGAETGELKANTDYIKKRIDDVLLEQRELNRTVNAHAERLTRVEESAKQAHKRIDRMERNGEE